MTDNLNERVAEMTAQIADLEREVDGYKRAVKAAEDDQGKTVVVLVWQGSEMRVFGPTPEREQAFAETVVRYIKLIQVVADDLSVNKAREQLDAIRDKLDDIDKVLKAHAEQGVDDLGGAVAEATT